MFIDCQSFIDRSLSPSDKHIALIFNAGLMLPLQDDQVVLQCTASILKEQIKLCLSCEGFGNRLCFLETTSNAQVVKGHNV